MRRKNNIKERININKKGTSIFFICIVISLLIIAIIPELIFQWAEFYKGYSLSMFNLRLSMLFLLLWFILSFYFGSKNNNQYKKFFLIYCSITILINILNVIFTDKKIIFPFYMWFDGPLYGLIFLFDLLRIGDIKSSVQLLIISPLQLITCSIGYSLGKHIK